jgi:HSP20 family molecular chaperone IbpA
MDTLVVTVPVPATDGGELSVDVREHTLSIGGPDGFRHELTMSSDADMERLQAQLYRGILELRAPRGSAPAVRRVPVETLA